MRRGVLGRGRGVSARRAAASMSGLSVHVGAVAAARRLGSGTPAVTRSEQSREAGVGAGRGGGARRWRTCEAPRGPPRSSPRPPSVRWAQPRHVRGTRTPGGHGAPPSRRPLTTNSKAACPIFSRRTGRPKARFAATQRRESKKWPGRPHGHFSGYRRSGVSVLVWSRCTRQNGPQINTSRCILHK